MQMERFAMGLGVLAAALVVAAGCSTVERARKAQEEMDPKGAGVSAQLPVRLDLRGYSLEQLVGFALTNRPSVVSARLAVEDARLALKALAADAPVVSSTPWTAPHLSLSGHYAESSPGTTMSDARFETSGSPSAGLSLDLLIWDFGRYDARARAQAERVLAAERGLVDEGFTVFSEVSSAYFTYLEKNALHEVAIKNEHEYAEHLRRAEARLKAGEAQKLDVLKARLDLAKATETVVSMSNLVMTSGATLMGALGIDASRGSFAEVVGLPDWRLGQVRRGFSRTSTGIESLFDFARTNAPSMQVSRANLRAASADIDASVADLYPTLSASLSFSWTDPLWFWNWGVSAAQSLFEGYRKVTAVDRAVVALRKAAAGVDRDEQDLSLALEIAVANRDNSVKALETAHASVVSARENLEVVQQQLNVGSVSRIELSEAISYHSTALGSCITAFYTGQIAEARLFKLVGTYPVYHEEVVTAER